MRRGASPPFLEALAAGDLPGACLLGGEAAGLAGLLADLLLARCRRDGESAEIVHATAADFERESPVPGWRTPSFFVRRRIVVLADLAELKKGPRKELLSYLEAPEPSVTLVLPCTDREAFRAFSAGGAVRSAAPREDQVYAALARFATEAAQEAGKELPEDAAEFLARWVGADSSRLKAEVGKLVAFVAGRRAIGEEDVRAVCIAGGGVDPFRLAEELFAGNRERCLALFRRFAASADPRDYHGLVGAIAWSARRRLGGGGGRGSDRRAPLSPERSGRILTVLSRIDRGLKGESRLSAEQVFEIGLLALLA